MTSTRKLPLLTVLLTIAAMFGLVACGDDDDGDTGGGTTTTSPADENGTENGTDDGTGDEDAAAALGEAAALSADQTTIEMTVLIELDGELLSDTEMASSADGEVGRGVVEVPPFGDVETLIVDETIFYAFPDLPDGIEWAAMTFDELREQTGVDPSAGAGQDPADALLMLTRASRDVTEVGEVDFDGIDVRHFRMTADVATLMDEAAAAGALTDGDEAAAMFGNETVLDVYVDEDGLVRRMAYELETTPEAQVPGDVLGYVFEYSYSDEPLDVTAPPEDTVISVTELAQMSD